MAGGGGGVACGEGVWHVGEGVWHVGEGVWHVGEGCGRWGRMSGNGIGHGQVLSHDTATASMLAL